MGGERAAVRADWALTANARREPWIRPDTTIVIEDGRIVDLTDGPVQDAENHQLPADTLLLPGFVDLHTHSLNGPLFRATTEDRSRGADSSLVYDYLMPVGDLASRLLTADEATAVYTTAMARALLTGTTTVLEVFRPDSRALLEAAVRVGLRTYAAPYLASSTVTGLDADGRPRVIPRDEDTEMRTVRNLLAELDAAGDARIRPALGPHCTDTCSPQLLRRLKHDADERGEILTIHAAQSRTEVRWMQRERGVTPIRYLVDHGICGAGVVLAHAVFASDEDLTLLADTGTALASCPATFAQGGHQVDYRRFVDAGVSTGIGTDGYSTSYVEELRAAGMLSKTVSGVADEATALDLLARGTAEGAAALGRTDLGVLRKGARADLVAVTFDGLATGPVLDPARSFVWHPSATSVSLVMVGGEVLVRDGHHTRLDLEATAEASAAAIARVWDEAWIRLGIRPTDV